jgi:hypothetical protein
MTDVEYDIRKNDRVQGWFGDAVVTDVGFGYVENETEIGPRDDMVRVVQQSKTGLKPRYVYKSDIKRNLTAEASTLRG